MILLYSDQISAQLRNAPGSFAGLMDLYERNYIGIRRLVPVMPATNDLRVSQLPGGLNLYLEVLDRFRYTTELSLTYHFHKELGCVAEPDLRVRIYHDARLAEVVAAQLRRWPAFRQSDEGDPSTPLCIRWHINRFLCKWLNYCLHQGHRFAAPL
ncbi:MAG: DUF1249 domain-containing protein [Gammaproteobacteria bacterium]|nr:DUF1249 domain-containing protein [Gammaproteobacteria bacterium]MCP5459028.1 DUF1249 domain-containing protein [Gammaproteobacteria bacterium]